MQVRLATKIVTFWRSRVREVCSPLGWKGSNMDEITPKEFKQQWDEGRRPVLIDVRQPDEWEVCNLEEFGAKLIPLGEIQQRFQEIPKDGDIVMQCRSGGRSGQAQGFLKAQGYTKVQNLVGGMLRWSDEVDSSKAKY